MAIEQLYDKVIMDHINNARNYRELADANRKAEALSTLCGDSVTVYLKLDGECIHDVAFQCSSCAISMAAASIMTETVKGKQRAEAQALLEAVTKRITQDQASDETGFNADQAAARPAQPSPGTHWARRSRANTRASRSTKRAPPPVEGG
jgi:SUF system NifU family Fe-S assembly protein